MRSEKLHLVNLIGNQISNADYVYFITYGGMTVQQLSDLRVELDKVGAECHIYKNTLIRKAGELLKVDALATFPLTNDTALIFGQGDAGAAAKVIIEYGKKLDKVAPKGGYFEGNVLSKEEVENIASLPAKPVLQAMLLGVLQAPSRNLVSVLNAKAASILNVLNAYKEKLESN